MFAPTSFKTIQTTVYLLFIILVSCKQQITFFQQINPAHSGIYFNNRIIENDSVNQLDIGNVYNGAGAGIGDFNNDGLQDIYFSGNLVPCKLYLNKGDFVFLDVTDVAGVSGEGKWCSGVAVTDINNDGRMDIYVCATLSSDPEKEKTSCMSIRALTRRIFPVLKKWHQNMAWMMTPSLCKLPFSILTMTEIMICIWL